MRAKSSVSWTQCPAIDKANADKKVCVSIPRSKAVTDQTCLTTPVTGLIYYKVDTAAGSAAQAL